MGDLKILTNVNWFNGRTVGGQKLEIEEIKGGDLSRLSRSIASYLRFDLAILNGVTPVLYALCLFKLLFPFSRLRIVSVDLILSRPATAKAHLLALGKRLMLKGVDHFLLYMKDTEGYQRYYGISQDKFHYIPFKINTCSYVMSRTTADHGYLFTGGVSKRDYDTLFAAVRDLPYKVMVLVPPNTFSEFHGTKIYSRKAPPNVTIVHDDGSPESWVDHMSRAKLVILPIRGDTISPSGVSTYLTAMALRKCVIVSEGPATRGVIPEGAALVVPPGDPGSLRQTVIRACEDHELRERVAGEGYTYAVSLKDHERLVRDILDFAAGALAENAALDYGMPR